MQNNNDAFLTIDFKRFAYQIKRNILLIIAVTLACASLGYLISAFVIKPVYSASAQMLVTNRKDEQQVTTAISQSDITASSSLVDTYAIILKSDDLLEKIIETCELPYSTETLSSMISVSSVNSTQIMRITVHNGSSAEALKICQEIVRMAPNAIIEAFDAGTVSTISSARTNGRPVSPSKKKYTELGGIVGLLACIGFIAIREITNDKFKVADDVKTNLDMNVLSVIPEEENKKTQSKKNRKRNSVSKTKSGSRKKSSDRRLHVISDSSSFGYTKAFKELRTNMKYLLHDHDHGRGNVVMITSSIPGEGKSNVSVNLAITLAQEDKKVILIDCDLRKGTLHRYLNVPPTSPGLSSVLSAEAPLSECVYKLSYGFSFIPVGALPDNPSELIGSRNMGKLLSELSKSFDYIICDTAPVNAVADTSALCRFVDGILFIVSYNNVTKSTAISAKERLEGNNANVLGAVLNRYNAKETGDDKSGYYTYYNYNYYGYGENQKSE